MICFGINLTGLSPLDAKLSPCCRIVLLGVVLLVLLYFRFSVILAFDVKVERDAQDLADNLGVKIFTADIIYHLFDKFTNFRDVSIITVIITIFIPCKRLTCFMPVCLKRSKSFYN